MAVQSDAKPSATFVGLAQLELPRDALLRQLPMALDLPDRLRFDAIVFAADAIANAFRRIFEVTAERGDREFAQRERVGTLIDAWTIVDQIHALRQLLREYAGPQILSFIADTEPATLMRNKMDHLSTSIGNLAKRKNPVQPIFGVLNYQLVGEGDIDQTEQGPVVMSYTAMAVMAGSMLGGVVIPAGLADGDQFDLPAGRYRLSAFDLELDLSGAIARLGPLVRSLNETFNDFITERIEETAARTGHSVEEMSVPVGGNLTVALSVALGDDAGPFRRR